MTKKIVNNFTLIEIVAVMALIAVLCAFAAAYRFGSQDDQLSGYVRQIKTALEQTRSRAIAANRPMALVIPNHGVCARYLVGTAAADGGFRGTAALENMEFVDWFQLQWAAPPAGVMTVSSLLPVFPAEGGAAVEPPEWENGERDLDSGLANLMPIGAMTFGSETLPGTTRMAVVFDGLGQCLNGTIYLTIAEAIPDAGSGFVPAGSQHYITLKINELTGQIEYVKYQTN